MGLPGDDTGTHVDELDSSETGDKGAETKEHRYDAGDAECDANDKQGGAEEGLGVELGKEGEGEQDGGHCEKCERKAQAGDGLSETRVEPAGIYHAWQGLIGSAAAVGVVIGALGSFPPEQGVLSAALSLAGYPFMVVLFYVSYCRWGRWLGAPPRLVEAGLGFAIASWLLLFSGDEGVQRLSFWFGQTAVLLCGVSVGGGLALVSKGLGVGLRDAVRAVLRADRGPLKAAHDGENGR